MIGIEEVGREELNDAIEKIKKEPLKILDKNMSQRDIALSTIEALAYKNVIMLLQIAIGDSDEHIKNVHGGELGLLEEIRQYMNIADKCYENLDEKIDIPEVRFGKRGEK